MQWEVVGNALRDSRVHVGAINCMKHRESCWSLKVERYPTLLALNWPGALQGKPDSLERKLLQSMGSAEEIVKEIEEIFCEGDKAAVDAAVPKPQRKAADADVSEPMPYCMWRVEDAVASIRLALTQEVFTQGSSLSRERLGGYVHDPV